MQRSTSLLAIGILSVLLLPSPVSAYGGYGVYSPGTLQRENVRRTTAHPVRRNPVVPRSKKAAPKPRSDAEQPAASPAVIQNAATVSASIEHFAFSPAKLTVKKGATVTWLNRDATAHTVTGEDGRGPQSGRIQQGDAYSYVFLEEGIFRYHCTPHPSMQGVVEVVP